MAGGGTCRPPPGSAPPRRGPRGCPVGLGRGVPAGTGDGGGWWCCTCVREPERPRAKGEKGLAARGSEVFLPSRRGLGGERGSHCEPAGKPGAPGGAGGVEELPGPAELGPGRPIGLGLRAGRRSNGGRR